MFNKVATAALIIVALGCGTEKYRNGDLTIAATARDASIQIRTTAPACAKDKHKFSACRQSTGRDIVRIIHGDAVAGPLGGRRSRPDPNGPPIPDETPYRMNGRTVVNKDGKIENY